LYLEKLQAAEQIGEQRGEINGRQDFVLRLLNKRVGVVSAHMLAKVMELSLEQLENLYDAALDFTQISDLKTWLDLNR
jgi:predicted transposase YdaD